MKYEPNDYVIRVLNSPDEVNAANWNELLSMQPAATPFMRHEYLAALHASGSATPATGWTPHFIILERDSQMVGACVVYVKAHSFGEYVFDRAWANAYAQHGLAYYPKAVVAVPFTPVPGTRLMARTTADRAVLAKALIQWCEGEQLSSLHLLFAGAEDIPACLDAGMMLRHTVQFHWTNTTPAYADFDSFLASLSQEKRKKIRQERRKVSDAGVTFRWSEGTSISEQDWDFFYRCYERTYLEHGNAPYLNRDFFRRMANTMPENWLLFVAERDGQAIATSLIAINAYSTGANGQNGSTKKEAVAYGRYWGALERVNCLHFEACYYQPLQWCIEHGYQRFEGGAQGEHKMARALLPVKTTSTHWLAHPAFADAVERFLEREDQGIDQYLDDLVQRTPFRNDPGT
ncbi:MAG: GNAT family N-acetyltransferase [Rhodoferax sp.]|uniref:GNAT family N-acetyltransferase n=1 Tax=Rhodoferax sp. TaxID=50421 RepID=UPI00272885BB|nr:GNAT family N-acetyltransferase [Rhodoferax sp.]MDO8447531.1 GNAT family N-acetyltransferase [Rhodoferax sp.]